ncbi:MAG TPA: glycosyltransferase [Pirellulales bacterium]|nr:glycosyltransferase [Pirellulales bacterium]
MNSPTLPPPGIPDSAAAKHAVAPPDTFRPRIAVLIPCYNESVTIAKVVQDFRRELPNADIYVYDNNSSDGTDEIALHAGARVVREKRQGKGFVVASMFRDIEADAYVMVDGDDTYPANRVRDLLQPVLESRADVVVGNRLVEYEAGSYRPLHVFGNLLVVKAINFIFKSKLSDVMSGYRCFSREAVRTLPVVSRGFEVETELTLQALYRNLVILEIPVNYGKRPEGSYSKLSTYRDGAKVLRKIFDLFRAYRPLLFFSAVAIAFGGTGLALGSIPVVEFIRTGKILHFPTAILAAALEVMALVSATCGLVLDSINHHFRELSQLVLQAPRADRPAAPPRDS